MKSSKPGASVTWWFVVADEGMMRASLHRDSQSNESVNSDKGSETVCLLGIRFKPQGFLTTGSLKFNFKNYLFCKFGGVGEETSRTGVDNGGGG